MKSERPQLVPHLRRSLREGYQLSIEDICFTDVPYQEPCDTESWRHSRWNPRIDISGKLTNNISLRLPILSSSMPGVTNFDIAIALRNRGGLAVLPRELVMEDLQKMISQFNHYDREHGSIETPWYAGAVGVYPKSGPSAEEKFNQLVDLGAKVMFIETQQANSALVMDFCKKMRRLHPSLPLGVGVFNSVDGVRRAVDAGADLVKIGIGAGDACLTTIMSGVGKGQVNTVYDIARYFDNHPSVPVIVDGGTSTPGGAAIMMTLLKGNGSIMLGSKIAATFESDSKTVEVAEGKYVVQVEGMGSEGVDIRRGGTKAQRILEGTVVTRPVSGSINDLLIKYEGGFRTAMYGYHGAKSWDQLASKAVIGQNSPSNIIARMHNRE